MCFSDDQCIGRRAFISSTSTAVVGVALRSKIFAQAEPANALNNPAIIQGAVTFENGPDRINGYLARPRSRSRCAAVIILMGDPGIPEDMRNTLERLMLSMITPGRGFTTTRLRL